ncbi:hypothetical protein L195_g047890 [Trifolium pratense]|uniref:Uncharacterized protein n=1 Tax=Trifolium pratense TaxID=57577 RepID=A0A2K3MLU2_TRIPR|nr:hypothetical protein L195_g047890 [Trifolium pratense]
MLGSEDATFRGCVASDSEVLQMMDCRHRHAQDCRQAQQTRRLDLGQTSSFAKTAIYKMNKFLDEID